MWERSGASGEQRRVKLHLLEMAGRPGLGLGVLRYQVRSRLSAWARPTSASVVVMCFMISSSASLCTLT